jgi:spermidine synthase
MPTATARATKRSGNPDKAAAQTSAAATAGSVLGTLATPLVILPYIQTNTALAILALTCGLAAAILTRTPITLGALALTIAVLTWLPEEQAPQYQSLGRTILTRESAYQRIVVKENDQGERSLILNNQIASVQSGARKMNTFLQASGLGSKEKGPAKSIYLGGGAFLMPMEQISQRPKDSVTVIELDPDVVEVARTQFGISPKIAVKIGDARKKLGEEANSSFDLIFCNTYLDSVEIPAHLSSAEFFALCAQKVKPEGMVMANVIGPAENEPGSRIAALSSAMAAAFEYTDCHRIKDQKMARTANHMLRGSHRPLPKLPESLAGKAVQVFPEGGNPPTDNFNPTEFQGN